MSDSERYAQYRSQSRIDGEMRYASYCARRRCHNRLIHQEEFTQQYGAISGRRYRYPADAVVLSYNDGTEKKAYCSFECARTDINTMIRKLNNEER